MTNKIKQKKYWETKEGDEIEYKKLKDDHLLNILKWIKRRAEEGVMEFAGSTMGDCAEDWWGESWEIYGDEVLEKYDYKGLLAEAKRRKILPKK